MKTEKQIRVWEGDITTLTVDAIVNAANSSLLGGGGVDGAIHRAAGPALTACCATLGGCPTGEARITPGFRLPARHVIHTVGPVWANTIDKSETLASCYRESLRVADELGAASVAFPTISAGVYGWPMDDATRIAVETVRSTPTTAERVLLVAFNEGAEQGYRDALGQSEVG